MGEITSYAYGSNVRLGADFANSAGTATDTTTARVRVKDPSDTVTTYTSTQLTHDDTGSYYYDKVAAVSGLWYYEYDSTGALIARGEKAFRIERSQFDT